MNTTETFNHKAVLTADEDFFAALTRHVHGGSAPVFHNDDGTINREKTLTLPCYENFKEETPNA